MSPPSNAQLEIIFHLSRYPEHITSRFGLYVWEGLTLQLTSYQSPLLEAGPLRTGKMLFTVLFNTWQVTKCLNPGFQSHQSSCKAFLSQKTITVFHELVFLQVIHILQHYQKQNQKYIFETDVGPIILTVKGLQHRAICITY